MGDLRQRVVIAADGECLDTGLMQALHFRSQKARGLHRRLLAVIEIAGDDQCIDLFLDAEIDNGNQRLTGGDPDHAGKFGVAERQRTERGIEVNIGGVDETKCHAPCFAC